MQKELELNIGSPRMPKLNKAINDLSPRAGSIPLLLLNEVEFHAMFWEPKEYDIL